MKILHSELSDQILKTFYGSRNNLPFGLELSFYKNMLEVELLESELEIEIDKEIEVKYKQNVIGKFKVDFIIADKIIIQIVESIIIVDEIQIEKMKMILKMTKYEVGLILNYGSDGQHKRVFISNDFKKKIPVAKSLKNLGNQN